MAHQDSNLGRPIMSPSQTISRNSLRHLKLAITGAVLSPLVVISCGGLRRSGPNLVKNQCCIRKVVLINRSSLIDLIQINLFFRIISGRHISHIKNTT